MAKKKKKKKLSNLEDMIRTAEAFHSLDDEALIYLKSVIEGEMKDRKLKIDSDYDIRPKHSWIYRFLRRMGVA